MATDPFHSARRAVQRALKHADDLRVAVPDYVDSAERPMCREPNPDGLTETVKLSLAGQVPDELSEITSDAFVNLRNALDRTGFSLALASGIVAPKHSHFPFVKNSSALADYLAKGRAKDLPAQLRPLLTSFKPYQGGDDALWAINEVANQTKHRSIIITLPKIDHLSVGELEIKCPDGAARPADFHWDRATHQLIVKNVPIGSEVNYEFGAEVGVALGSVPAPFDGRNVVHLIDEMIIKVRSIVDQLEIEARRLGILS